jgi:hypothetical protein
MPVKGYLQILEDLAENPEQSLSIHEVAAVLFACGIVRSLSESQRDFIEYLFNLTMTMER